MAGGSAGNEAVGPMEDKGITGDFGGAEAEERCRQAYGPDADADAGGSKTG